MTRWDLNDLQPHLQQQVIAQLDGGKVVGIETTVANGAKHVRFITEKPRKYRNEPIIVDGYRFDSKLEARYYGEVKLRQRAGYVAWFIRQVRFDLPGRVIYRADFLEVLAEGRVVVTDCKGRDTQPSINKRKQVYALYGVQVQLWTGRS